MITFQQIIYITAIVSLGTFIQAVPIDTSSTAQSLDKVTNETNKSESVPSNNTKTPNTSSAVTDTDKDLETSNSHPEPTYVLSEHQKTVNDNGNGHFDPSIYAGYLTPESFQQYLAQFAGAYGPYGYPGYAPAPVYPAPYAVQTGYEGFLVPSTSLSASGTVSNTAGGVLNAIANLIPALMQSTIVRVIATVLGAILMMFFGGAITTAFCNLTNLCDISFKAVEYLKSSGAGDVGRMVVEEITPERIRRASEFVRNAIRKYKEMQKQKVDEHYEQEE